MLNEVLRLIGANKPKKEKAWGNHPFEKSPKSAISKEEFEKQHMTKPKVIKEFRLYNFKYNDKEK